MARIKQLAPLVVNKIAAGEVIERPASVVKELMENAIDAGARRIDVVIEKGGIDLIRVADDGCGVEPDDMSLAVASHATSKIESADDLFSIRTLGFRGEALASISAVSRTTIRSRTASAGGGIELEVVGGEAGELAPCGCPAGTILEVRNLFFNTPVRRKFLRTTQTEMGHCSETFTRLALAHPHLHFTLSHNERIVHDMSPTDDWRTRIALLFGDDLADGLIAMESIDEQVSLTGYVANPSFTRGNNRWQYLFLNGRYIRDRSLQHALGEAYRGLILTGRHPICFLNISIPPKVVDVNVHPTKLEVRFQDAGQLYSQLLGTLRERFLTSDLTARMTTDASDLGDVGNQRGDSSRVEGELVDWAKRQLGEREGDGPTARQPRLDWSESPELSRGPLQLNRIDVPPFRPFDQSTGQPYRGGGASAEARGDDRSIAAPHAAAADDLPPMTTGHSDRATGESDAVRRASAMQIHNRYLITECDDGVVVIDQHALHERILYEQIREKVLDGALESQSLLVPEPVDLSAAEAAAVIENCETLQKLGVGVEPFGGETVLVSSYPAMLANLNPAEVLRSLAEQLVAGTGVPTQRDLLDELLHMISCKAAIKAGDRLSPEEVESLVEHRELVQDSHHCPHGRPTTLVLTRDDLDRQFKRI